MYGAAMRVLPDTGLEALSLLSFSKWCVLLFSMTDTLTLGTRASALALAQTELTRAAIAIRAPLIQIEIRTFTTRGDQKLDLSLIRESEAGGKGLFTKELEEALLAKEIDVAVHSMKDMPSTMPDGLQLTAVLERAATGDLLISKHERGLAGLPPGAHVGTSSIRRARQIQWLRQDVEVQEWRGNVQTRLRKLGENEAISAIVLAEAGLARLGIATSGMLEFEGYTFQVHSLADDLLPAIGQGAVALQTRILDRSTSDILHGINHAPTFTVIRAERELQRLLSGDCTLPVGVRTSIHGERIEMEALLFLAGKAEPIRASAEGDVADPESVAAELCTKLQA